MTNRRKLAATTALALCTALPVSLQAHNDPAFSSLLFPEPSADLPHVSAETSGTLTTSDGLRLRVDTAQGDIRIVSDAVRQVSWHVAVEADPRDPDVQSILNGFTVAAHRTSAGIALNGQLKSQKWPGRMRVEYEIHVPRRYDVDVITHGGNISLQDVDGRVSLITAGGNISTGRIGFGSSPALSKTDRVVLETQGGHITVGDVEGNLRANTAGGHVTTGNIGGNAIIHSDGGYIHVGNIAGTATFDTAGGNIRIASAGSNVTATTGGGQIDLGEAAGLIHAQTKGGAVRIGHLSGAATVETVGSVFLRQVDEPLRVSSASGNITAWFSARTHEGASQTLQPTGNSANLLKMVGASQLTSGEGDVTVYLPRNLSVTIDATLDQKTDQKVGQSGGHQIVADPSLALKVRYRDSISGTHAIHCEASMNGGGEVLSLKAVSGNIYLRALERPRNTSADRPFDRTVDEALDFTFRPGLFPLPSGPLADPEALLRASGNHSDDSTIDTSAEGFFDEIRRMFDASFWGVIPVDSAEMQRRLVHSVVPVYPEVARKAGIEGTVTLRVFITTDGRVESLKVLAGPPILARAAIDAVRQWQYRPVSMDGRAMGVITDLTVAFRLN